MIKTLTKRITAVAVVTALVIMTLPLMRPAYAGSTPTSADYKARMDEAQKLWDKALLAANEKNCSTPNPENTSTLR